MSTDEMSDEDWSNYETGPFCRHWGDPSDCDRKCVCGHTCVEHDFAEPGACMECDCKAFDEPEDEDEDGYGEPSEADRAEMAKLENEIATGTWPQGPTSPLTLIAHPVPPKSGAPVTDYSYSISVDIGQVDRLCEQIAKAQPLSWESTVVADLRELADSIEKDPDTLVDMELTIDPMCYAPRLKAVTVRVKIKPDGDSE
jgi:hypothetical protein